MHFHLDNKRPYRCNRSSCMQRDRLQGERKILVRNISCIFRTAQEELSRKNEEIESLRRNLAEARSRRTISAVCDGALPAPLDSDNRTNSTITANY